MNSSIETNQWLEYDGPKDNHPVWKHPTVWVDVQIRHNASGEIRVKRAWMIYEPEDGPSPSVYMYEDGNYSCDCNRHLFFHRAAGVEPMEDAPCGKVAYDVNLINPKTGKVFYREFFAPDSNSTTNDLA
jgi:hypothetical protein